MALIKRIINRFNKKEKIVDKENKIYISSVDIPNYMIISNSNKEKLLYNISLLKKYVIENIAKIDDDGKTINSYSIYKIDDVVKLINKNNITILSENEIYYEISKIVNDKKIYENINLKLDDFYKNTSFIINEIDKCILTEVIKKYNKINYITLSTIIIDRNYDKYKKLEEEYKNHRYNKYYYERELKRIKHELNDIKLLKNRKDIKSQINNLKKELYTKSKDKYDILYGNEVFMAIEYNLDKLFDKINAKIIDLKKEKKETKKDNYLDKISQRFEDLRLANELILKYQKDYIVKDQNMLIDFINQIYKNYNDGLNDNYHFEKNKHKTELVILYNGINEVISFLKKEPYIKIDHINFRINDIIEAVMVKKGEVNQLLKDNIDKILDKKIDKKINKIYKEII